MTDEFRVIVRKALEKARDDNNCNIILGLDEITDIIVRELAEAEKVPQDRRAEVLTQQVKGFVGLELSPGQAAKVLSAVDAVTLDAVSKLQQVARIGRRMLAEFEERGSIRKCDLVTISELK